MVTAESPKILYHNTALGGSGGSEHFDGVDHGVTMIVCTMTHTVTMMTTARRPPSKNSVGLSQ